ncbi:hypothetical protein ACI2LJ_35985 [Streptomyces sp. NPDC088090]|uniref:hypothetical protein n=1 Tax=Streptomyces sp. NPDC088090 TaxID=3365822 RepID=UPI00384FD5E4
MTEYQPGVYETPDDLLAEFFDDPADREDVRREAEQLAAEERGARLVELRERTRTPRETLADRMGVPLQHVVDLENGDPAVNIHRLLHRALLKSSHDFHGDIAELWPIIRYLTQLSDYVRALGGDVDVELVKDTAGATTTWNSVRQHCLLPEPSNPPAYFTGALLSALQEHRPTRLRVWAEVEGWRTDIAA